MEVKCLTDKGVGLVNEDSFMAREDLFGVFDGASSLDNYIDKYGKTGGYIASNIAKQVFEANNKSLIQLFGKANNKIRDEMNQRKIDIKNRISLWSTSVAVIKLRKNVFDWVQIGDSLIIVISNNGSYRILIDDYDHDKEIFIKWKALADKGIKDIRKKLSAEIIKLRMSMNIKYGILNGENKAKNFLRSGRENLKNIKHILLFTDGLFIPNNNPKKPNDFDKLVDLYLTGGLEKTKKFVRKIEKSDPECIIYPRYKTHDDIAAISISF